MARKYFVQKDYVRYPAPIRVAAPQKTGGGDFVVGEYRNLPDWQKSIGMGKVSFQQGEGLTTQQVTSGSFRTAFDFAKRELKRSVFAAHFWAMLAVFVLLIAVAGPFSTYEHLPFGWRLIYWGAIALVSWLMMRFLLHFLLRIAPGHWPAVAVGALSGVIGTLPVMGLVEITSLAVGFGLPSGGGWQLLPSVAPGTIGISILVVVLTASGAVARARGESPDPAGTSGTDIPEDLPGEAGLFSRLPPEIGREIVTVQAQDHYIEVTTPKGSARILMRLGDASGELAGFAGLQVHRSWWVNLDHVVEVRPTGGGRFELVTGNGRAVPVPRARLAGLQDALRRRGHDARFH